VNIGSFTRCIIAEYDAGMANSYNALQFLAAISTSLGFRGRPRISEVQFPVLNPCHGDGCHDTFGAASGSK